MMFDYRIISSLLSFFKKTAAVKKIDKILSKFGYIGSMERTHVDTFTENRIKNIGGKLIASSNFGKIWFRFQELGGFHILNVTVLSGTAIKSNKGCILLFCKNEKVNLSLKSDEQKIKSDFSNVSNQWITEISYDLTKKNILIINESNFTEIRLDYKNKSMPFYKKS